MGTAGVSPEPATQIVEKTKKLPFNLDPQLAATWIEYMTAIDRTVREAGVETKPLSYRSRT